MALNAPKGQGASEYLLLIGGAVLVAAIVIALVSGMKTETAETEEWVSVDVCAEYMKTGNLAEINRPCEELGPGWKKEQLPDGYLCKKCILTEPKMCLAQAGQYYSADCNNVG